MAADIWRQIASWAALLEISIIDSMGALKTTHNIPERFREKLCRLLEDVHADEEAVDLISQGYFEGNEVLFADAREYLKAAREGAQELMSCFNWFAAETGKELIDNKGKNDACAAGRVKQLLNDWVRLSRGKALAANGKVFEARDEILAVIKK